LADLVQIATAAENLAQCIAENYPISAGASPDHLPYPALGLTEIRRSLRELAQPFSVPDPLGKKAAAKRPQAVMVLVAWPRGWPVSVTEPLASIRNLFTSLNEHFHGDTCYAPDVWSYGEQRMSSAGRLPVETNGHLPAVWVKSLKRSARLLRRALVKAPPEKVDTGESAPKKVTRRQATDLEVSEDGHVVKWMGQRFTFTSNQAACFRILHEAGGPVVDSFVLEQAEVSTDRLANVFRTRRKGKVVAHEAWNKLIVPTGAKGLHCLATFIQKAGARGKSRT